MIWRAILVDFRWDGVKSESTFNSILFRDRASSFVFQNLSTYQIAHPCPKYHCWCCWWWWWSWGSIAGEKRFQAKHQPIYIFLLFLGHLKPLGRQEKLAYLGKATRSSISLKWLLILEPHVVVMDSCVPFILHNSRYASPLATGYAQVGNRIE